MGESRIEAEIEVFGRGEVDLVFEVEGVGEGGVEERAGFFGFRKGHFLCGDPVWARIRAGRGERIDAFGRDNPSTSADLIWGWVRTRA